MQPNQGDNSPAQPLPEVTALLQALRQVKTSKNLSLDAFTHDTGYSRSSWNRVLKGTAFPPRAAVERLCSRRGLDKNTLLGLWDTADQARRAADTQDEAPSEAAHVPAPADSAPGVPDPTPPTALAPDPTPPTAAPDPTPSAAADPVPPTVPDTVPGTAAPKPAAATPAPAPSTPGPAEPARPAAAPRSRIKILALIAAALAALLLVGRWYSVHETKDSAVSQPETGGDNRPGDDQPVADETPVPPKSSTAPTKTPPDDEKKDKDQDSTGEEDTNTKPPRPSSSAKDQASSPASASASPSTAASPGAAGRASCRYNWDRTQVMAKGMVGSKVKQIQCLLNSNYDYTLTVDGKFGESTDVAVRAVQSCSGLNPDGQVGPQTWKYLDTPMSGCGH
ncbi:peptidoglycan-binding protein (plasmid) [Streptomyces sp. NBC_01591]|uniref:peptidoglycan-binding protein n=1 Tax=Streptomyces sp. NBC_01591 TaxID=2975888 RepID=UPI002DD863C9|nr:peptidoglycan-binding protein [Streptomyces sp. NBC_01591]WSD66030.1 peptidoglycan-binding protein [Streptomyces sp. NBC_01591]WSD73089.1 peptidoglycan-binding protein [Streptomyces sp. NBC_01591]WSD73637.1 peptidoglycan-binding protein [Streptomyces sp. NBC_01591]WSD74576.1 peptidoglycan-binding protein [Streptomyces sp. NBC_01591]